MEEKDFSLPQKETEMLQRAEVEKEVKKKNAFTKNRRIRTWCPSDSGHRTRLVGFLDFEETDE